MSDIRYHDVPDSVREAGERAARLIAQLNEAQNPSSPTTPPDASTGQGGAGVEEAGGFGGESPASGPQRDSELQAQPSDSRPEPRPEPRPESNPESQSSETRQDSGSDLESELRAQLAKAQHDLSTWRGRHNADTKRLTQQIEALTQRIEELQAAAVPPIPEARAITEEDRNTYGEDLLDVIARQSHAAVLPVLKALEARLVAQIESVRGAAQKFEEVTTQTKLERFFDYLDRTVPEWRTTDTMPEFHDWLAKYDPLLRRTRKEMLDEAIAARDGESAAAFVRSFLSQKGGTGSQVQGATARPSASGTASDLNGPARENQEAPPTLMDFAAPGKASSPRVAPVAKPAAKIWTLAEIQKTYNDIGRGRYRDDPAKQAALEREIAAAQAEGRVR